MDIKDQLIVALDFSSPQEALDFVDRVDSKVIFYKVGLELYLNGGEAIIHQLKQRKKKIFLDLKFYDIPNTMIKAIQFIADLDIDLFTFHMPLGEEGLYLVYKEVKRLSLLSRALGVTVLTHFKEKDFQLQFFHSQSISSVVLKYAQQLFQVGFRGMVCSGEELSYLNEHFLEVKKMIKVVPGIRMMDHKAEDQNRVVLPSTAWMQGANFLVMGRPITQSKDPFSVIDAVHQDILDQSCKNEY